MLPLISPASPGPFNIFFCRGRGRRQGICRQRRWRRLRRRGRRRWAGGVRDPFFVSFPYHREARQAIRRNGRRPQECKHEGSHSSFTPSFLLFALCGTLWDPLVQQSGNCGWSCRWCCLHFACLGCGPARAVPSRGGDSLCGVAPPLGGLSVGPVISWWPHGGLIVASWSSHGRLMILDAAPYSCMYSP